MKRTPFVSLDIHQERISSAVAERGRPGGWNTSARSPTISLVAFPSNLRIPLVD